MFGIGIVFYLLFWALRRKHVILFDSVILFFDYFKDLEINYVIWIVKLVDFLNVLHIWYFGEVVYVQQNIDFFDNLVAK